jgi:hypothetical protein
LISLECGPRSVGKLYNCSENKLKTLKGSPNKLNGKFICCNNNLTSLESGPIEVLGDFICNNNLLVNLIGSPIKIGSGFNCSSNLLNSLEGLPVMDHENLVLSNNVVSEKTLIMLAKDVSSGTPYNVSIALSWDLIDYRDQEHLSVFLNYMDVSDYIFMNYSKNPVKITKIYDRLPVHIKQKVIVEISKRENNKSFQKSIDNVSNLIHAGILDDV